MAESTIDEATEVPVAAGPVGIAATISGLEGVPVTFYRGDEILFPTLDNYVQVATTLRDAGFITCSDLCAVDYLTHMDRALPAGVGAERFEIVVQLLSHERRAYLRLRVQVPAEDAVAPTLFYVYPGTENMEREAFDLFGIVFTGHPDMTRILMPQDWEGHPLRKDYSMGRVPVQFKDAPGPR
jgi:NADH-quinone oxidoreductase subunit C